MESQTDHNYNRIFQSFNTMLDNTIDFGTLVDRRPLSRQPGKYVLRISVAVASQSLCVRGGSLQDILHKTFLF